MAARNVGASESAEGWTNPYITDGLVAMWDGEWNIGGGKHDDNATVWVDLAGNGYDLMSIVSGGWVNGNARLARRQATGLAKTIPMNDILTISVCCKNISVRSNIDARMMIALGYQDRKLYLWKDRFICSIKSTYSPSINIRDVNSFTIEFNASTMNSRPQNLGWYGDVPCETYLSEWVNSGTQAFIGEEYLNGSAGVFYNIRIYNRYLTQEEITYNWNIDKERFDL